MKSLIRITAPHFVAGLIIERQEAPGGPELANNAWHAVDAAPILYWMVKNRWTIQQVGEYLNKKGWQFEVLGVTP